LGAKGSGWENLETFSLARKSKNVCKGMPKHFFSEEISMGKKKPVALGGTRDRGPEGISNLECLFSHHIPRGLEGQNHFMETWDPPLACCSGPP
jgi:hypothetical protein